MEEYTNGPFFRIKQAALAALQEASEAVIVQEFERKCLYPLFSTNTSTNHVK